jgi:hypothetical protein
MNILLGDLNANLGREDIFTPVTGNESLIEITSDNGVRKVNSATSKNLIVKSTMFTHRNIRSYKPTPPCGKSYTQIGYILIDRRKHSNVLEFRSLMATDCDTEHYLVVVRFGRD